MWRERIGRWIEGRQVQRVITALIILNAASLGMETAPSIAEPFGPWLHVFDNFVLGVFVIEISGKLLYRGWGFFRNGWNVFDFVIVGIALMPTSGSLAVLRALRVLRTLRLLSVIPSMRRVVQALLSAIPGLASVSMLILLIFYVGAVLSTKLFGERFPDWFGTIGESMYTLFQVMTLESWSMGIVRPVMEVYPQSWVFFVPFILITSFAVLNLFIGIMVDAMQSQHVAEQEQIDTHIDAQTLLLRAESESVLAEIRALREEVRELKGALAGDRPS